MTRRGFPAEVGHLPVCPVRGLPVPYIAERAEDGSANFTILDNARAAECLRLRLCAMCGLPMGAEVAFVGDVASLGEDGGGWWVEPPVHERCAELAVGGLCPYLSGERVPRRDHQGDPTVALVAGTPAELAEVGRSIAKRPIIIAITRTYGPALVPSAGGAPLLVYQAGVIRRVRRFDYGARGRLAEVTAPPSPAPPGRPAMPRHQPRRQARSTRRPR